MTPTHKPVLLDQTIKLLEPKTGESYFDGTAGYGGHAKAIIERIGEGRAVLADRDEAANVELTKRFGKRATIIRSNYLDAARELCEQGDRFDMILLDLGVSSPQLDVPERGFSFKNEGPLDMRMDQDQSLTAAQVVNGYPEAELARIIWEYGEERRSRAVARAIVGARPLKTTTELAKVIRRVVGRSGDIDPATRTFQAIRIEVNAEITNLEQALPIMTDMLDPSGRIAVISFHSLEDRIVKQWFVRESKDCICPPKTPVCICNHQATLDVLTRRPITGEEYDATNPRARSAKLRAAVKLTPKQKERVK
jgi:16S rRNA (cytosine1402-N4)-methyltransferase